MRKVIVAHFWLLATVIVTGQFIYPDASAANLFHDGDTVMVSYATTFATPALFQMFCGESTPRANITIHGGTSTHRLDLTIGSQPRCYLQLNGDTGFVTSIPFSIATENGTVTIWNAAPVSSASVNLGSAPPGVTKQALSLAIQTVSVSQSISTATATVTNRPVVTLSSDRLESQYAVGNFNCLNGLGDPDPRCWDVLEMDRWLPAWLQQTSSCPANSQSDATCRNGSEPWTVTFLREASGPGPDCLNLGRECYWNFNTVPSDPLLTARYKYASLSIVSIAQFFKSWDNATSIACVHAFDIISSIITLADPNGNTNLALSALPTAFGMSLSLIPVADPAVEAALGLSAKFITELTKAIFATSAVAQQIWPVSITNSQTVSITDLANQLDGVNGICTSLHGNFINTLRAVLGDGQNDTSAFMAFASGGAFSLPLWNAPAVVVLTPQDQSLLLRGFTTFLTSEALSQNDWRALILPGVDPAGLQAGTAPCPQWAGSACKSSKDFRCNGYDGNGQCNNNLWWYGSTTNSAYTLLLNGKFDKGDTPNILRTTFANGWSTGSLFFENAAICEFTNVLPSQLNYTPEYMVLNGTAGFAYSGPFSQVSPYTQIINSTAFFLPIDGGGFVILSENSKWSRLLYHPQRNPFSFSPDGVDLRCVSQLNVSVANSWMGKWEGNAP
ncbi:hypothetical protein N7G274_010760 [Stereocaulon virgatum]|uniref:Uncharacterized protein n=1 Tax=Stereocaulon virgatum TaxID=373712 RepID=A0ABR3ZSX8_9LECA